METNTSQNIWQTSKLLVKGLIIGVLVLLLLIPAHFVKELIQEREQRQQEAVSEVSSKWAGPQIITGPVLVLPYWEYLADTSKQVNRVRHYAYFLPDSIAIRSDVTPVRKHRGIYSVMLYNSTNVLSGYFKEIPAASLKLEEKNIIWDEVFVKIQLSDSRGLNNEIFLNWNDTVLSLSPQSPDGRGVSYSLSSVLPVRSLAELKNSGFNMEISLKGSEQLLFSPVGKTTTVEMYSTWAHPSFSGNSLPENSSVDKNGFTANWRSLSHTRLFPQQWKDDTYSIGNFIPDKEKRQFVDTGGSEITASAVGTGLFVPVNGYQQTMRSIKYAILCILLTFTAFFLIETIHKKSVHPVHYALIGFALILFYTLLLSFSEYTGFAVAYAVAALATTGLISWFVKGLLGSGRLTLLLSVVLVLLYSYVFTTLQLQDFALLLGSIGLFLTLAVVMRFSRKIQW